MLQSVNALQWLARHRMRRTLRGVYASQMKRLDTTFAWLTTAHPEWPTKKTAKQVMRQADAVLDLNRTLYARGVGEGSQLERDPYHMPEVPVAPCIRQKISKANGPTPISAAASSATPPDTCSRCTPRHRRRRVSWPS
jgi:hypothetical protein